MSDGIESDCASISSMSSGVCVLLSDDVVSGGLEESSIEMVLWAVPGASSGAFSSTLSLQGSMIRVPSIASGFVRSNAFLPRATVSPFNISTGCLSVSELEV